MRLRSFLGRVKPVATLVGMTVTGILLVATIFLTLLDLPWVAFLTGMLCAAAIGVVSRYVYDKSTLARMRENIRHVDVELPAMIVYVAADGTVLYHNRAFRQWLKLRQDSINGRPLRDVIGLTIHGQLKAGLDAALSGASRVETLRHAGPENGDAWSLVQYLPHRSATGEVAGAYLLQSDLTTAPEIREQAPATVPARPVSPTPEAAGAASQARQEQERGIFVSAIVEGLTEWKDAGEELRRALAQNEFCLYVQRIAPVATGAAAVPFYEMLLRLQAEEDGLMPPGAFLPLAEEFGLLPDVDRWVVAHVLNWACARPERQRTTCCLNISAATLAIPEFTGFVTTELQARGVSGAVLCFEIQQADALLRPRETARFVSALAGIGCRTTLCRFGQSADSFGLLKELPVDFLKIDGDLVYGIERSPVDLIKLKAITRVAKATNRRTIAVSVEDDATLAKLRELGVDFAQGFGVDRPRPLADLD